MTILARYRDNAFTTSTATVSAGVYSLNVMSAGSLTHYSNKPAFVTIWEYPTYATPSADPNSETAKVVSWNFTSNILTFENALTKPHPSGSRVALLVSAAPLNEMADLLEEIELDMPTSLVDLTGTMDNIANGVTYVKTENNFTNTLKTKLDSVETNAQKNVNADWNATEGSALILNKPNITTSLDGLTGTLDDIADGSIYVKSNNNFSNAYKNKLDGIADNATGAPTGEEILTALLTVDGSGSNLDADTVDGLHASAFAQTSHTHTAANVTNFDTAVSSNADVAVNTAQRHVHSNASILNDTTASFTTALKSKLDGIEAQAQKNVKSNWTATAGDAEILNKPTIPTSLSQLSGTVDDLTDGTNYVRSAKNFTAAYETKLLGIEAGADVTDSVTVSSAGAVMNSGNQNIAGVKSFTAFPVTPSAAPSSDYQVANKKYVDDKVGSGGGGAVTAVNGKTGAVVLTQDDINSGVTYVRTHNDFTDADKAKLAAIEVGATKHTTYRNAASANAIAGLEQGSKTLLLNNIPACLSEQHYFGYALKDGEHPDTFVHTPSLGTIDYANGCITLKPPLNADRSTRVTVGHKLYPMTSSYLSFTVTIENIVQGSGTLLRTMIGIMSEFIALKETQRSIFYCDNDGIWYIAPPSTFISLASLPLGRGLENGDTIEVRFVRGEGATKIDRCLYFVNGQLQYETTSIPVSNMQLGIAVITANPASVARELTISYVGVKHRK